MLLMWYNMLDDIHSYDTRPDRQSRHACNYGLRSITAGRTWLGTLQSDRTVTSHAQAEAPFRLS